MSQSSRILKGNKVLIKNTAEHHQMQSLSTPGLRSSEKTHQSAGNRAIDKQIQRQNFLERFTSALMYTDEQYTRIASVTELLAVSYHEAWKRHSKVLDEAKMEEQLLGNFILDSALAFIPGGIAGTTGHLMKGLKGSIGSEGTTAFIIDGVKDLLKITLRRQISRKIIESEGLMPKPDPGEPGAAYEILPDDPFEWRGRAMQKVLSERASVLFFLRRWYDAVTDESYEGDYSDPYELVKTNLRLNGRPLDEVPTPNEKEPLHFEKGFWKGWIEQYRYYMVTLRSSRAGTSYQVGDRVPKTVDLGGIPAYWAGQVIRERILDLASQLGEDGNLWLDQWGIESRKTIETERDVRNEDTFGGRVKKIITKIFGG